MGGSVRSAPAGSASGDRMGVVKEPHGTPEEEAHRRAEIIDRLPKESVNWQDYAEIIEASEPWDPIQWPENHDWELVRDVPLDAFRGVTVAAIADVEDPDERREHRSRYKFILGMLRRGEKPWPIIVGENGMILDGYHRLAALHTLRREVVDVLYVSL